MIVNWPSNADADDNFNDESETEHVPILENITDESCCQGNTSESDVSGIEQHKNDDGSLQDSYDNISGEISGP